MIFKVLGEKGILVELKKFESETITEEGLYVPLYANATSDGNKPIVEIDKSDNNVWSTVGTVVQISERAREILDKEKMDVSVGDVVYLDKFGAHPSNQFIVNRDTPVQEFDGMVTVRPGNIQAVKINYTNE